MGFPCRRQIFLFLMLLLVNIAPLNANIQLKINVFCLELWYVVMHSCVCGCFYVLRVLMRDCGGVGLCSC